MFRQDCPASDQQQEDKEVDGHCDFSLRLSGYIRDLFSLLSVCCKEYSFQQKYVVGLRGTE